MPGITNKNMERDSFAGLRRDHVIRPGAADADYFTSASDGGSQASFSITSAVVGTEVYRSATGKRPLMTARRLSVRKTDNSGSDLTVKVRIFYRRFGVEKFVDVNCNGAGTETVDAGVCADELSQNPKILEIANAAASDTLAIGYDAAWVGLVHPISKREAIRQVLKITSNTPDANGPKISTDITAAMVDLVGSALDTNTLYSAALTANDDLIIEYLAGGSYAGRESIGRRGYRFG